MTAENGSFDTLRVYVDGSYRHDLKAYGYGCVFLMPDGTVEKRNGAGTNPETAAIRNVGGEMIGAMTAVRMAMAAGFRRMELYYDYEGIEKWATGKWKTKNPLTKKYKEAMEEWSRSIKITFRKVEAHTGVTYNEMADKLAKEAIEKLEESE